MELVREEKSFIDSKTGQEKKYYQYYVIVLGVPVYLQTIDKTGKALLNSAFNSKQK